MFGTTRVVIFAMHILDLADRYPLANELLFHDLGEELLQVRSLRCLIRHESQEDLNLHVRNHDSGSLSFQQKR